MRITIYSWSLGSKMASAKFLEEALSTDVDESAVNAIVGSLETQLVTSTPVSATNQSITTTITQHNHQLNSGISNGGTITAVQTQKHAGVANGGGATSANSLMTQEVTKSITTSTLVPVNVVTSNAIAQHTQSTQHQQQQTQTASIVTSAGAHINQVNANQVTSHQSNITNIAKSHDSVKVYTYGYTGIVNNKLTFPAQTVAQLANGTLGVVTSQAVLQTTSNVVTNVGAGVQAGVQTVANVNKQGGTALVIKTSGTPGGMVSVPMSVPVSVAGNAANTTMHGKAGVASTIVPSNVQILNVNPVRPGTPVGAQQAGKQVGNRVVTIGQQFVGARPGVPGVGTFFILFQ